MGITDRIPGMVPGETKRNVVLGVVYVALLPITLSIGLGLLVASNYRGLADRLSVLPGVESGGGNLTTAAIALYAFVVLMAIGAAMPADPSASPGGPAEISAPNGTEDSTPTAQAPSPNTDTVTPKMRES